MLGIAGLARVRGPAYQWVMNDTTPSGRAARNALVIGTRASPLARAQSAMVGAALRAAHPGLEVSELVITTSGDRFLDRPLADIGGKGLFTKEIEDALASGAADIAVHSMKDVPTVLPDGLVIACMMAREDVRDVLVTRDRAITRIEDLPAGTRLGTASLRRGAQARARCKDLKLVNLRGNVGTRLQKINAGEADATFLALAGLKRLGITDIPGTVLAVQDMLPAVGQGAVGIECRADDVRMLELLAPLDHPATHVCVRAERALLAALDGSCRMPIAALATVADGVLTLDAMVAAVDGSARFDHAVTGAAAEAEEIGAAAGARLREQAGADFFARLAQA
jgi:hydroxymethylbilane synthase